MTPLRLAAVLMPIFTGSPPLVLFVLRGAHLRRHAGQVAFPGGVVDAEDEGDHRRTALREAYEELQIAADRVEVIARLPEAESLRTGFRITPFVGLVAPGPVQPDGEEIAGIYEVPLDAILEDGAVYEGVHPVEGQAVPTWRFDYGVMHVWGATGRILRSFVEAYAAPDSALRARLR